MTGVGLVTAFGLGYGVNAAGFRQGRRAFQPVTLFDVSRQRVREAAQVHLPDAIPNTRLSRRQVKRLDRASILLAHAAAEVWDQAGWHGVSRLPVVLGTTSGGMSEGEEYYRQATRHPRQDRLQATRIAQYLVTAQTGLLGRAFGFEGSCYAIANACASGTHAVGQAWSMIRHRQTDRVLTGGYDALSQLVFAGFDSLQALSPTWCRPFDAHRDGLALGEGAGVLALEAYELAQNRGAPILGEIVGFAAASDAHHLTQLHPEGDAALRAMNEACRVAGVTAADIGYLNAHGTGTLLNDSAECAAIHRWAGERVATLDASSTKGGIGHLLGAAGAVEAILCLMALREGWLPPNVPVKAKDSGCRFNLIQSPTEKALDYAMSNSFGFGGANATLVLKRAN